MKLKSLISRWLGYSRRERAGSIILIIVVSLVILFRYINSDQQAPNNGTAVNELPDRQGSDSVLFNRSAKSESAERVLFKFDPNTVSRAELIELGLSEKQANTLINYRSSGARFKKPDDFRKVYGISKETQDLLIGYIEIDNQTLVKETDLSKTAESYLSQKDEEPGKTVFTLVEINSADSLELMTIPGIGKVLGPRIVKYRTLLGGFYSINQLSEVYGLDSLRVHDMREFILLDTAKIVRLNVNEATYGDLIRHPYLSKKNTEDLLNYRRVEGQIRSEAELVRNNILTTQDLKKVRSYISFDMNENIKR